ncbi:sensor histidine kinase [sulfur-oxidizing endosymbiont of Gigantopelta aegis]|uniref:sensor histidine kinase n=1 Tax=sulfur-oxidizing endosymbiont of Gigantopelta aegis TaxID=2794934 RepID=UPI0018DB089D|nr:HAMP domain-containing sensor histidine kinase [sulfur-oxidizing endosymbiont of Gigantopelta aegis]
MAKKLYSIFSKEHTVLRNAEKFRNDADFSAQSLEQEYDKLVEAYRDLLKHTEKLTNIGDINQMKLLLAEREAKKQQKTLEETAVLRENVERIIHHDLKNPLHAIISLPTFLIPKLQGNDSAVKQLQLIRQSGERMNKLINRSLEMYKMEVKTYELEPVKLELISVIKNVIDSLEGINRKNISVNILLNNQALTETDEFFIFGEDLLCFSLLSNLLKNALEASSHNDIITIALSSHAIKNIKQIAIHNQGAVPKEIHDTFFEKYSTQGKKDGTGLGTYSARLNTETLGGEIQFTSSDELGTTVTVSLPAP